MIALAWSAAALFFLLWLVEHLGGDDARGRLRRQRDDAQALADERGLRLLIAEHERDVARSMIHPSGRLRIVKDGDQ